LQQEHLPRRMIPEPISEPPMIRGIPSRSLQSQRPPPNSRLTIHQPVLSGQGSPRTNGFQVTEIRPAPNKPPTRIGFGQPATATRLAGGQLVVTADRRIPQPGAPLLVPSPHRLLPQRSASQFNQVQPSLHQVPNQMRIRPPMHPHAPQLMSRQNQLSVQLRPLPPSPSRPGPMGPPHVVPRGRQSPGVGSNSGVPVRLGISKAVRPAVSGQKRKAAEPLPSTSKRTLLAGKDGQPIKETEDAAKDTSRTPKETPVEVQETAEPGPSSGSPEVLTAAVKPPKAKRMRKRAADETEEDYAELFGSDEEVVPTNE